jgi:hypothetical protein
MFGGDFLGRVNSASDHLAVEVPSLKELFDLDERSHRFIMP